MSIVALSMNILLGALLVGALIMGWRLERRLKALRTGHDDFARAVADLDAAAMRAQAGLMALRAATDEADETLNGRIAVAQELVAQLDRSVAERPRRSPGVMATPARDDDWLDRPLPVARERPGPARFEPQTTTRSRARIDDDLFEPEAASGRLRAIPGGRL
ncbi:MAG: flagellar positioning protein PflI [Caulobacter sp.]|nr:flagellar positioning protein PflI [Caulobacter sp.]